MLINNYTVNTQPLIATSEPQAKLKDSDAKAKSVGNGQAEESTVTISQEAKKRLIEENGTIAPLSAGGTTLPPIPQSNQTNSAGGTTLPPIPGNQN